MPSAVSMVIGDVVKCIWELARGNGLYIIIESILARVWNVTPIKVGLCEDVNLIQILIYPIRVEPRR